MSTAPRDQLKDNPYDPSQVVSDVRKEKGLVCPYCDTRFRLTWRFYFRHPFAKLRCPCRGGVGKRRVSAAYYAFSLAWNLLQKAPLILDETLEDAVVQLWNTGRNNEKLYYGLN